MAAPRLLKGWFRVRKDLDRRRSIPLTVLSFLFPLILWCVVSYVPWIWHPDVRIEIAAEREDVTTVFTAGDSVSKDYFPTYAEAVRVENRGVLAEREAGESETGFKRKNQKLLRQITPVAIAHGWLDDGEGQDDAKIYSIWRDLATGDKIATNPDLSEENLEVVRANWEILGSLSEEFDYKSLPDTRLLKLVPQGVPANPSYLPTPGDVIKAGIKEFKREPSENGTSMGERYVTSLGIVFRGFMWACLVGVPIGILCGTYSFFSRLFEPFTDFFRYMPAPTFSTLLVAIMAADDAPKIALVFIGTLPHMILMVAKTTRLLDASLLEAAQTLGASPRQMVTRVVIPGIMPSLYNDLRILLGWAWTWLVIAELIGVKTGLTEFIETQGRFRNFDRVFPVIILIGVTGFTTDQFLAWLHGLLFPWAGTSGRISRSLASLISWPARVVAEGARERVALDEAERDHRRALKIEKTNRDTP